MIKRKDRANLLVEAYMENQINVGNQNTQQIGQNPINQNVQTTGNPKVKYLALGIVVFLGFLLFGLGGYYFGKQSTNSYQDSKKTANQPLPSSTTTEADDAAVSLDNGESDTPEKL